MKKLSLILALILALTSLGTVALAEEKPVITVQIVEQVNMAITDETLTFNVLEEALGITLDIQQIATSSADYQEKFNLMLASGDYPDVFMANASWIAPYLDAGIVVNLTDVLPEKMPNVLAEIEKFGQLKNAADDNGQYWFIPKLEGATTFWCNDWINQRWLDNLGLEMPTTTDELYEVLKAFKENDANGNGDPDDEVPMCIGPWVSKLENMKLAFGTYDKWIMFDEATGVEYPVYDRPEKTKEYLTFMNKLYTEGLLDQEYLTRDDDGINALIANDQTGYFYDWADDAGRLVEGGTLGVDYVYVKPIAGPDGTARWKTGENITINYYIAADSENLEKVYEMFNYIYGEEGRNLFTWGVEGVTYEVVDGEKDYTDMLKNGEQEVGIARRMQGINPVQFPHVSEWEGWAKAVPEYCVEIAEGIADTVMPPQPKLAPTVDEEIELANIMVDIDEYVKTSLAEFINGSKSLDEFDDFIAQLEKMGIKDAKAIKDAQFARYMAR